MNDSLRPSSVTPKYPFYHQGPYLEEYFFLNRKLRDTKRKYIDVFWTNIYSNRSFAGIHGIDVQHELDKLNQQDSYYTVCQNDDGILERLPPNTLKFCSGGNQVDDKTIPIPLIASPIGGIDTSIEKDLIASFVGSNTHPLRVDMHKSLRGSEGFVVQMKNWSLELAKSSSQQFMELSSRSKFMLAPRGYGRTSFRLYEAFQFNSIPVYISDSFYLPYTDKIDWSDYAVLINPEQIKEIPTILRDIISTGRYDEMMENIQKSKHIFGMEYMVSYIEEKIETC